MYVYVLIRIAFYKKRREEENVKTVRILIFLNYWEDI